MPKIQPIPDTASSLDEDDSNNLEMSKSVISVKSCVMALILIGVLSSVGVLTVIWITSFSTTISSLSTEIVDLQQYKLVSHVESTLNSFLVASDSVKSQLVLSLTNATDYVAFDKAAFFAMKSEKTHHYGVSKDVSIYNIYGYGRGYTVPGPDIPAIQITATPQSQTLYICIDYSGSTCITPPNPLVILPPYDQTVIFQTIKGNEGNAIFTPSYTSTGTPETFITMINSNKNVNSPKGFDWYIQISLGTSTLSDFMKKVTRDEVSGSAGIVLETSSNYLLATSYPELFYTINSLGSKVGITERFTGLTFNNTLIREIYSDFVTAFPKFSSEISCNNKTVINTASRKISIYRYCNDFDIDWFIIFAVPQWNYISNMIIAIICALSASALVIGVGTLMGVYSSSRIVKPIHLLIAQFEQVSRMELEIDVVNSKFTEVSALQDHFKSMVKRIKLYRAFLPPHLLSQLDGEGAEEEDHTESGVSYNKKYNPRASESHRGSDFEKSSSQQSHYGAHGSSIRKKTNSLFKLNLEHRNVSFLMIFMDGFKDWLERIDNNELLNMMSEMFDLIQKVANQSSAQLGQFDNESIILSWNSTINVDNHQSKVVSFSYSIMSKLQQIQRKWKTKPMFINNDELFDILRFRMACHCQNVKCGNVGTKSAKTFTIIGSHESNLQLLLKHGIKMNTPIVASSSIIEKSPNLIRFIGDKKLFDSSEVTMGILTPLKDKSSLRERIYQVGEPLNDNTMDEWMYELQAKENKNKWQQFNQATELFFAENYQDALKMFKDYKANNTEDLPTKYLLKKCKKKVKKE